MTLPVVTVQDAFGDTVLNYTGQVTVSIKPGSGTTVATLVGTTTVNAVGGVVSFSGLSIEKPGIGNVLLATGQSLTGAESAVFDVTPFSFTIADCARISRKVAGWEANP